MKSKKAFTLAEILIVLAIIGIIAAVVVPTAINSAPDEDVLKFKKANSTFSKVIGDLATSGKYFTQGNLGKKPDGTLVNTDADKTYLCTSFADLVSTKSKNCVTATYDPPYRSLAGNADQATINTFKGNLDSDCSATSGVTRNQIVTSDGISWYEVSPGTMFGNETLFPDNSTSTFDPTATINYKVMCFGFTNEYNAFQAFGYAVRSDGRVIPGAKADTWMTYSIQKGGSEEKVKARPAS